MNASFKSNLDAMFTKIFPAAAEAADDDHGGFNLGDLIVILLDLVPLIYTGYRSWHFLSGSVASDFQILAIIGLWGLDIGMVAWSLVWIFGFRYPLPELGQHGPVCRRHDRGLYDHDRDWASFNARLVQDYRLEDFTAQVAQTQASHQGLVAALQALEPADFVADFGVRFKSVRVTVERLALWEARDEQEHAQQILVWMKAGAVG